MLKKILEEKDYGEWKGGVWDGKPTLNWKSSSNYLTIIKVPYDVGSCKYIFTGQDGYGEKIPMHQTQSALGLVRYLKKQYHIVPTKKEIEAIH